MLKVFFKDFIYLFLERGEEGEREGNINVWLPLVCPLLGTWPATQACALTGNQTSDPSVCKLALNPLSHTSQGNRVFFYNIDDLPKCLMRMRHVHVNEKIELKKLLF